MKKILVIEDDEQLQQVYQTKFSSEGFDIVQTVSGEEGVKLSLSEKPDLILLDIMLPPPFDGFTVLSHLKQDAQTKNIPVIVMTNLDDKVMEALQGGAVWYFVKAHTSIDDVVKKVKEFIG
jgi:DNA-binding response OmpR family regulator